MSREIGLIDRHQPMGDHIAGFPVAAWTWRSGKLARVEED
jgi:hypothetical protein